MHIAEVTTWFLGQHRSALDYRRTMILTVTIQPVVYNGFSSWRKTRGPMKLPDIVSTRRLAHSSTTVRTDAITCDR
jgi:hypothetical protein